jgi:hypothetical protein
VERGFSPLDKELALSSSAFSPFLVEGIVRLGTEMPFERAPEVLSFFTELGVGEETVRELTERAGVTLVALVEAEVEGQQTEPLVGSGGPAQQVSADGAMVHLVKEGWAEVKTIAIGRVEVTLGGEVHARDVSYFSRLDNAQVFGHLAEGELRRRETHAASAVCAVSDGAEWLQHFVDWHLPNAVRILDFPHAAEYVHHVAQAVFGQGTAATSEWVGKWLHELRHGNPDDVLTELRTLATGDAVDPQAAQIRDEALAYLEKRRALITYAQFAAAGYPIGSGMVESANKLVVEERLKGAGMHWARCNVNPMLALRTTACSHRWKQTWPQIWEQLCLRPRARRAGSQPPAEPTPVASSAASTEPSARPKREPAIKLEKKGTMQDGKPTADHPFKQGLRSQDHDQRSAH